MTAEPSGHGDEAPHHPTVVPDVVGHPRHTGRFWFDFAAATAAIFISVVSLFVAISGESTQRELLAANSWPYLSVLLNFGNAASDHLLTGSIRIVNDGVGPAKVETFEAFYDGKPMHGADDLLAKCCGLGRDPELANRAIPYGISNGTISGNVLRAGDSLTVIGLREAASDPIVTAFERARSRFTFKACYCSILDRCWISDLKSLDPPRSDGCPPVAHPFDLPN